MQYTVPNMRLRVAALSSLLFFAPIALAQDAPDTSSGPTLRTTQADPAPIERHDATSAARHETFPTPPPYDPNIFANLIRPAQLKPMLQAEGATVSDVFRDRPTRRLIMSAIPDVIFRYGRDISLPDVVTMELDQSPAHAHVRDNRYVLLTGDDRQHSWIRHDAHTLLWVDTQEGIVLGAFFWYPTNGEPGPTITIFTNQIKQYDIRFSELPPAFLTDLDQWQRQSGAPPALISYFIGDIHKKFLLEHDLDLCIADDLAGDCEQLNANAADNDLTAALYLDQVNYATNATAYMIDNPGQIAWLRYRNNTCATGIDPLACQIRLTRQRITVIQRPTRPRP